MCGISLVICGIRIDLSSILVDAMSSPTKSHHQLKFSIDDFKETLRRRGPDSVSCKKVFLNSKTSTSVNDREILSVIEDCNFSVNGQAELLFIGSTLQLRGVNPIIQPLVDSSGNVLVYNGEIFGGIHVESDSNDAEILMQTLAQCYSCNSYKNARTYCCKGNEESSVVDVLSTIKGPWALIYWQDSSKTLWFGRDAFGRRSLLVHWPTVEDARFLLSSVSPPSSVEQILDPEAENGISKLNLWEELPCGIYSLSMQLSKLNGSFVGEVKKHEWTNTMLTELIKWERNLVEPKPEYLSHGPIPASVSVSVSVQKVLNALRKSVMQRTSLHTIFKLRVIRDKRNLLLWLCSSLGDWTL